MSQLGLYRPISASSNSLFKSLPGSLHPFGMQFILNYRLKLNVVK